MVPGRITGYDDVSYMLVLSTAFPYYAVLRKYYNRITAACNPLSNPDRVMASGCGGGEADARRSGL